RPAIPGPTELRVQAPVPPLAGSAAGAGLDQPRGEPGNRGADRLPDYLSGQPVIRGRIPVDDDKRRARTGRERTQGRGRLHGERASNREEQVAAGGGTFRPGEYHGIKRLAEHHGRRLEYPA